MLRNSWLTKKEETLLFSDPAMLFPKEQGFLVQDSRRQSSVRVTGTQQLDLMILVGLFQLRYSMIPCFHEPGTISVHRDPGGEEKSYSGMASGKPTSIKTPCDYHNCSSVWISVGRGEKREF